MANFPFLSVTLTVNVNVPALVAVPVIFPVVGPSSRPSGSLPLLNVQEYGETPPLALRAVEYVFFLVPF